MARIKKLSAKPGVAPSKPRKAPIAAKKQTVNTPARKTNNGNVNKTQTGPSGAGPLKAYFLKQLKANKLSVQNPKYGKK